MTSKIAILLAFFMSLSTASFAGGTVATDGSINDGSNDVIEAWGGTRSGGDC